MIVHGAGKTVRGGEGIRGMWEGGIERLGADKVQVYMGLVMQELLLLVMAGLM